jgi:hypothetical protein
MLCFITRLLDVTSQEFTLVTLQFYIKKCELDLINAYMTFDDDNLNCDFLGYDTTYSGTCHNPKYLLQHISLAG